jgi:hypothetical protein
MKSIVSLNLAVALLGLAAVGCSSEGDTSPGPTTDPKARVEGATKGVESSTMTPEQKQAALDYLNQGAAGAEKMNSMAQGNSTTPK